MNKKAQEMSMSIVIIAALAVIVLLLVGSFMTGGFKALTGKITGFVSSGPSSEAVTETASCDSACSGWRTAGSSISGKAWADVKDKCAGGAAAPSTTCVATSPYVNIKKTDGTCIAESTASTYTGQLTIDVNKKCSSTISGGSSWGN